MTFIPGRSHGPEINRPFPCAHELCPAVGLGLLEQSPIVGFYEDHGITLSERPYWRLPWCVDDHPVTVLDEDPWRLRVDIDHGGDRLEVVVDGDLAIVETTRDTVEGSARNVAGE